MSSISAISVATLDHSCSPQLHTLQFFHVLPIQGSPTLNPAVHMCVLEAEQRGRITICWEHCACGSQGSTCLSFQGRNFSGSCSTFCPPTCTGSSLHSSFPDSYRFCWSKFHSFLGAGHGISFCNLYGIIVIFCVKFCITSDVSE